MQHQIRTAVSSLVISLVLSLSVVTTATAQEVIEAPESGFRMTMPDVGWHHVTRAIGDGLTLFGAGPRDRGGLIELSIQPNTVADNSVEAIRAQIEQLKSMVSADESITMVEDREFTMLGRTTPGLRVGQAAFGNDFIVHIIFLRERGIEYRIQFHAPRDEFEAEWVTAQQVLDGFELMEIDTATAERLRLQRLAGRCGSQVDWASSWDEAAARARSEKRLVVVAIHAIPGFDLGDPLNESLFTEEHIVDLMDHRFVGLKWTAGMPAPFVSHDVFGLSGSTFGTGLLVCTPGGDVLRQVYLTDAGLTRDVLHDVLRDHPLLAPAPRYDGDDAAAHVEFLIESGQIDAAWSIVNASDALHMQRARLHILERDGDAALVALEACEQSGHRALLQASAHMGLGDNDAARPLLERCLEMVDDAESRAAAMTLQGMLAWAAGDVEHARETWTSVTHEFPDEPAAWMVAAGLIGPALRMGIEPDLSWPDEAYARLAHMPPADQQQTLDPEHALTAAVDWLLLSQNDDGVWAVPAGAGTMNPAPDPITMASHAIAITALTRAADATDDPQRSLDCQRAARRGLDRYLVNRRLGRDHPRPVAFMDYTCWGSSYGLFCLADQIGRLPTDMDLMKAITTEGQHLIDDLVGIQQQNGGWSYYISGDVGGEAAVVAMSFTTATVLLALDAARAAGLTVPQATLDRGYACLASMRGPNGNYEYMIMGADPDHQAGEVGAAGSAARGPVCTLALLRDGRVDADAMQHAFDTYITHLPSYGDESRKALMHGGPATQGSHYLLYDYSTAADALHDAELSEATRAGARDAILQQLARCRSVDGSFIDNPIIGPAAGTGLAVWTLLDLR